MSEGSTTETETREWPEIVTRRMQSRPDDASGFRAKLVGLQRNAVIVMGNSRSERYLGSLQMALRNGEQIVRRHAAWALGRIPGSRARRILEDEFVSETDPEVRDEIEVALRRARV